VKFDTNKYQNDHKHCDDCEADVNSSIPVHIGEITEEFLARTRRISIVGEINEITSTYICNYLQLFSLLKEPIYMYIHSLGGCMASGYAIIDQMLACNFPIYTIVRGQAHSMAAMIATFGTKGHRYATQNSSMMLHSVIIQNQAESIERHSKMTDHIKEDYSRKVASLAKRTKLTVKQLTKLMNDTEWMSPRPAIKIGLIDGIWTPRMEQGINKRCKL